MPEDNVVPLNLPYEPGSKRAAICDVQAADTCIVLTVKDGHWKMTVNGVHNAYEVMGKLKHISDEISKLVSGGKFHA